MNGVIVTKVETTSTTYCVKDQSSHKMIGYLKHNIGYNEYSFCASADAVVSTNQMQEILNHMKNINSGV
jgi:hypothetical protein